MDRIILNFPESVQMTEDEFFDFCQINRDLRIERNTEQQIIIMTPTTGDTGKKNMALGAKLYNWNETTMQGIVFDSSTGFRLPDGAMLSPDVSWIPLEKWNSLSEQDQEKFLPLCPDFVIELMSKTDSLKELQFKMQQWIDNGCRLAWLICPKRKEVYIYRPARPVEMITGFQLPLSGEEILPDFEMNLQILL